VDRASDHRPNNDRGHRDLRCVMKGPEHLRQSIRPRGSPMAVTATQLITTVFFSSQRLLQSGTRPFADNIDLRQPPLYRNNAHLPISPTSFTIQPQFPAGHWR
jgi:hypothetical protein